MQAEKAKEEAFRSEKRREEGAGGNHLSAVPTINKAKGILCWLFNKPASPMQQWKASTCKYVGGDVPTAEKVTFITGLYLSVQLSYGK